MLEINANAKVSEPVYEIHLSENVMIEARDGVLLATDIYRPAIKGQALPRTFPVLLQRTPYNKSEIELAANEAHWFAKRGYIVVIQDCRGCFESGGDIDFLIPEAEDGVDTINWIAQQDWCNGQIGTWGCSWASWTQTAPAALGAKPINAMVPNMSGASAHESSVRQGGALELRFLAWAFWHSAYNTQEKLNADHAALNFGAPSFSDWLTRMPIRRGQTQLAIVPPYEEWAFDILCKADYSEYWDHPSLNPRKHFDRFSDAPTLIVGGWYDSYTRGSFDLFSGLTAKKHGPIRVLMGPWTHGGRTPELSYAGDVEFGVEAALPSFMEVHLRWFDRWMRGVGNGLDAEAPIQLFVMGGGSGQRLPNGRLDHGGCWRDEHEWPLARSRFSDYYLHADGSLSTATPEVQSSSTTYRFDPAKPVPSCGGNVSSLRELLPLPAGVADPSYAARAERQRNVMAPGGFNQIERHDLYGCQPPYLPLGSRPDVLVFQTEPLTEALEVTGPIEVKLWVSSSAVDTDFTAKLIDVYPPSRWYPLGYALNLSDSIMRLRYRNGFEKPELVNPGEIVSLTITLYPTSNLFMPDHRIRLDISSSNFPRFDVNPNTGEAIGTERRRVVADNTVFHQAEYASRVILPVIPRV